VSALRRQGSALTAQRAVAGGVVLLFFPSNKQSGGKNKTTSEFTEHCVLPTWLTCSCFPSAVYLHSQSLGAPGALQLAASGTTAGAQSLPELWAFVWYLEPPLLLFMDVI